LNIFYGANIDIDVGEYKVFCGIIDIYIDCVRVHIRVVIVIMRIIEIVKDIEDIDGVLYICEMIVFDDAINPLEVPNAD
jgi:hypothetical protein